MRPIYTILLSALLIFAAGCSTIVGSVNKEPIKINPLERTWGSWFDDQTIETVTSVNIEKADPDFNHARVKVISFNGTVLLIGQVPEARLKPVATTIARGVEHVKEVFNELTVGPAADLLAQSNDSWLTSKVKSGLISSKDVVADRVKVYTEMGTVYLMGIVTPKEADAAVNVARNTGGVQKVVKVFEYHLPDHQ
ncbi:BON domain-containing protein [Candidatus Sororendozoicomonas aggregata]|uniref:BON domain-containing protein n=1 Tax=Candidatus Sororendozoicomonas aggregata TaxID=3073239 RepID=UPI002ED3F108